MELMKITNQKRLSTIERICTFSSVKRSFNNKKYEHMLLN